MEGIIFVAFIPYKILKSVILILTSIILAKEGYKA